MLTLLGVQHPARVLLEQWVLLEQQVLSKQRVLPEQRVLLKQWVLLKQRVLPALEFEVLIQLGSQNWESVLLEQVVLSGRSVQIRRLGLGWLALPA